MDRTDYTPSNLAISARNKQIQLGPRTQELTAQRSRKPPILSETGSTTYRITHKTIFAFKHSFYDIIFRRFYFKNSCNYLLHNTVFIFIASRLNDLIRFQLKNLNFNSCTSWLLLSNRYIT